MACVASDVTHFNANQLTLPTAHGSCHFANTALVCVVALSHVDFPPNRRPNVVRIEFMERQASAAVAAATAPAHACNTFNLNSMPHYHINWIRLNRFGSCVAVVDCRHLVLTD